MHSWMLAPQTHGRRSPSAARASASSTQSAILALQRAAGNAAVSGLLAQRDTARGIMTLPPVEMTDSGPSLPGFPIGIGPPPALADDVEADYRSKGEAALGA